MAEATNTQRATLNEAAPVQRPTNPLAQINEILRDAGGEAGGEDVRDDQDEDTQDAAGGSGAQEGEAGATGQEDADDQGAGGSDELDGLESILQLAEKAGISPDDLYKLQLPLKGRDPVTLGEAKDMLQDVGDVITARQQLEDSQSDFRKEVMAARAELNAIVQTLPQLPPELIARARQAQTETLDRERALLSTLRPEWKDDQTFQAAQDRIYDVVKDYGFGRHEIETVYDHRITVMLDDFARLVGRLKDASASAGQARRRDADNAPRGQRTPEGTHRRDAITQTQIDAAQGNPAMQATLVSRLLAQEAKK